MSYNFDFLGILEAFISGNLSSFTSSYFKLVFFCKLGLFNTFELLVVAVETVTIFLD
jgi:hypothetical protein